MPTGVEGKEATAVVCLQRGPAGYWERQRRGEGAALAEPWLSVEAMAGPALGAVGAGSTVSPLLQLSAQGDAAWLYVGQEARAVPTRADGAGMVVAAWGDILTAMRAAGQRVPGEDHGGAVDVVGWFGGWRTLPDFAAVGRRRLLVSAWTAPVASGEAWLNGPLAHVLPDGTAASYLPSGEAAVLAVPLPFYVGSGAPAREVAARAGTSTELVHRCLLARLDHRLPAGPRLDLTAGGWSLAAAVTLVLVRQARPAAAIVLHTELAKASLPPVWRRLAENLAVRWQTPVARDERAGPETLLDSVTAPGAPVAMAEMTPWLPDDLVLPLAAALNRHSDILPRSMLAGGESP